MPGSSLEDLVVLVNTAVHARPSCTWSSTSSRYTRRFTHIVSCPLSSSSLRAALSLQTISQGDAHAAPDVPLVIAHRSAKTHPGDFLQACEKPLSNVTDCMKHTWIIKCVMTQSL